MTRREERRAKGGRHQEKTKYKPIKLIVYCPQCEPIKKADPELDVKVIVSSYKRGVRLTCSKGHKFSTM